MMYWTNVKEITIKGVMNDDLSILRKRNKEGNTRGIYQIFSL